jgi:hypothetical protein
VTLQLASNVTELAVGNLADIASGLRRIADDMEAGQYDATTVMLLIDTPDALHTETLGICPTRYTAAGMLAMAQQMAFDD